MVEDRRAFPGGWSVSDGEEGRVVERKVLFAHDADLKNRTLGEILEMLETAAAGFTQIVAERVEPEPPKERWHVCRDWSLGPCDVYPLKCPFETIYPWTGDTREAAPFTGYKCITDGPTAISCACSICRSIASSGSARKKSPFQ